MRRMVQFLGVVAVWAACAVPVMGGGVVIVSNENPISKLTPDQVSQIFLGRARTFFYGGMAIPLDQGGETVRDDFYLKVLGKSQAQVRAYWSKMVFSGAAQPPEDLKDGVAVVKKVAENPKYIGYVDSTEVTGNVKVVLRF